MNTTSILDTVRIASPCHAAWEDMQGDERIRHCRACNRHVYNFSALTEAEITSLIRTTEGRLCARLYRRRDGTLLTADCPVGRRQKQRRTAFQFALGLFGLVSTALGLTAILKREPPPAPSTVTGMVAQPPGRCTAVMGEAVMGDVAVGKMAPPPAGPK